MNRVHCKMIYWMLSDSNINKPEQTLGWTKEDWTELCRALVIQRQVSPPFLKKQNTLRTSFKWVRCWEFCTLDDRITECAHAVSVVFCLVLWLQNFGSFPLKKIKNHFNINFQTQRYIKCVIISRPWSFWVINFNSVNHCLKKYNIP